MIVNLPLLIEWTLNNALIERTLHFSDTNWLNIHFFEMIRLDVAFSPYNLISHCLFRDSMTGQCFLQDNLTEHYFFFKLRKPNVIN